MTAWIAQRIGEYTQHLMLSDGNTRCGLLTVAGSWGIYEHRHAVAHPCAECFAKEGREGK